MDTKTGLQVLAAVCLLASACNRETPAPAAPVQINPPPSAAPPPPQPPVAPAAQPTPSTEPAPAVSGSRIATPGEIEAYNKALFEYCHRVSDIPSDLADLRQRRALPPLPTPPPGKRLVYKPDLKAMDYRTAKIYLD